MLGLNLVLTYGIPPEFRDGVHLFSSKLFVSGSTKFKSRFCVFSSISYDRVLYDRCHTRGVKYYGGLTHTMPIFIIIFLFFTMANLGLPGTSSFVSEFLLLVSAFEANTTSCN